MHNTETLAELRGRHASTTSNLNFDPVQSLGIEALPDLAKTLFLMSLGSLFSSQRQPQPRPFCCATTNTCGIIGQEQEKLPELSEL